MIVSPSIDEIRAWSREVRASGKTIGFVPTMGALHPGHMALVERAKQMSDEVAVSIFVNPTQFGPTEDLDAYPKPLEADLAKCREAGVAAVFTPTRKIMYPEGEVITVKAGPLGDMLEGESRPDHFDGVCTVVARLFEIVEPDAAVFGWKDAQQFLILRKMVEALELPIRMEGLETVREPDGLAMSSRNAYLTEAERAQAPQLQKALQAGLARVIGGCRKTEQVREVILSTLAEATLFDLDRLDIVHMETLETLDRIAEGKTLIAISAQLGKARLIDNIRC